MCKTFKLHSQVGADGSLVLTLTLCPRWLWGCDGTPRCGTPLCTCCTSWAAGTLVVLMTGKWVWLDLYGGKLLAARRHCPPPLWMRVYIGSEATMCGSLRKREAASAREVGAVWCKLDPLLNGGARLVLKRKQAAGLSFPSFRICWVLLFRSSVVLFCAPGKWFDSVSNLGFNTVIPRSV